jgi:co-chaperonin GroES (HSP10)
VNTVFTDYGIRQFQPLNDRLLVRRLPEPTKSLIYTPDIAQENSKLAEVMAIGKKVYGLKVGDVVLLPGVAAKYPDWEKAPLMLVQQGDVGGILEMDES